MSTNFHVDTSRPELISLFLTRTLRHENSSFNISKLIYSQGRHNWISKFALLGSGICLVSPHESGTFGSAQKAQNPIFDNSELCIFTSNYNSKIIGWK